MLILHNTLPRLTNNQVKDKLKKVTCYKYQVSVWNIFETSRHNVVGKALTNNCSVYYIYRIDGESMFPFFFRNFKLWWKHFVWCSEIAWYHYSQFFLFTNECMAVKFRDLKYLRKYESKQFLWHIQTKT